MKSLGVLIFAGLISVSPVAAQYSLRTGALGGPASARAFSHPLGGVTGARFNGVASHRFERGNYRGRLGYPYVYSTWVPDYYDYLDYSNQNGLPADPYAPAPQQPVIINQYFSAPPPQQPGITQQPGTSQESTPQPSTSPDTPNTGTQAPGDLIGTPKNYYLIAYKDHRVYPALTYWLEDKTLHYVTTENTHNQASLDLIDIDLTKSLNQRNEVPFSLPGQ